LRITRILRTVFGEQTECQGKIAPRGGSAGSPSFAGPEQDELPREGCSGQRAT
jgi:hypothetical protein